MEELKYDQAVMKKLVEEDDFLSAQLRYITGSDREKLIILFNAYVKGNAKLTGKYIELHKLEIKLGRKIS